MGPSLPSDFCNGSCGCCGVPSLPQQLHRAVLCCLSHCMLEAEQCQLGSPPFLLHALGSTLMLLRLFVYVFRQEVKACSVSCRSDNSW